jgi:hypothetical protein
MRHLNIIKDLHQNKYGSQIYEPNAIFFSDVYLCKLSTSFASLSMYLTLDCHIFSFDI